MEKKTTSFRLDSETSRSLKYLAFKFDRSAGDIINSLLQFPLSLDEIPKLCQDLGIIDPPTIGIFQEIIGRLFLKAMMGQAGVQPSEESFMLLYSTIQERIGRRSYKAIGMNYDDKGEGEII